jgi:hypothetical protein
MKTNGVLLTERVLRKPTLFPLFYELKHLLPYCRIVAHDLFFVLQNYMRLNLSARGGWPVGYFISTLKKIIPFFPYFHQTFLL